MILLAPMAGAGGVALAAAAMRGGALASLPCAMLDGGQIRAQVAELRALAPGPINLNFFAHEAAGPFDNEAWHAALAPYAKALGVSAGPPPAQRRPFDAEMAAVVEEVRPEAVSFHFGLPPADLLARVRAAGAFILSSATTVPEGRWLAERGVDAVIAQGWEAGGHSARFLPADPSSAMTTMALVPLLADATGLPIIAAGGIADGRGIAAAAMLGAAAVQIGTAFLACPESLISAHHRSRLAGDTAEETVMTNVFTGRLARGFPNRLTRELGPLSPITPPFPHAGDALAPLRAAAPADFANMWAGQAARLARTEPAEALSRRLIAETLALLDGKA
ncbi:nitronate monooxygenase [Sphingomonas vulcanisoli]|uniref:Propionate 3-nitronate monooxygenase n=1 Tax=Sphingomonas vulcanisoli TaxID=1658060 RepID=A0ABX0TP85_9SPHN|nr:nitronate monooxygenase [Sphingomonas vulcanisoli]